MPPQIARVVGVASLLISVSSLAGSQVAKPAATPKSKAEQYVNRTYAQYYLCASDGELALLGREVKGEEVWQARRDTLFACADLLHRLVGSGFAAARDALATESARTAFKDYYAYIATVEGTVRDVAPYMLMKDGSTRYRAANDSILAQIKLRANRLRAEF